MITNDDLNNWFTYHPPNGDDASKYVMIREKAKELAILIRDSCPSNADTTAAIRKVREAVMTANASIACK